MLFGLGVLGFTSLYREGFEVVLFLQSYRLRMGGGVVLAGVAAGLVLTAIVAVLTFIAHRKLPYRRMLVFTGIMLGVVLLVMVGEQAQEMQLAHWLPTTLDPVARAPDSRVDGALVLGVPDGGDAGGAGARGGDRDRLVLHRAQGYRRAAR